MSYVAFDNIGGRERFDELWSLERFDSSLGDVCLPDGAFDNVDDATAAREWLSIVVDDDLPDASIVEIGVKLSMHIDDTNISLFQSHLFKIRFHFTLNS